VVLSGERTRFADCSYMRTAALDVLSSKEVKQECQEVFHGKGNTKHFVNRAKKKSDGI
jgi:hypothetical protein